MKIEVNSEAISLHLHPSEAIWLLNTFQSLQQSYETPMESLSDQERSYWKGSLLDPHASSSLLKNASEALELERLEWKDHRLTIINRWLDQFNDFNPKQEFEFKFLKEEADALLQITNDRRLLLAANHNIQEEDMHHDLEKLHQNPKAGALIEIDFLAFVQSAVIHCLEYEPE